MRLPGVKFTARHSSARASRSLSRRDGAAKATKLGKREFTQRATVIAFRPCAPGRKSRNRILPLSAKLDPRHRLLLAQPIRCGGKATGSCSTCEARAARVAGNSENRLVRTNHRHDLSWSHFSIATRLAFPRTFCESQKGPAPRRIDVVMAGGPVGSHKGDSFLCAVEKSRHYSASAVRRRFPAHSPKQKQHLRLEPPKK